MIVNVDGGSDRNRTRCWQEWGYKGGGHNLIDTRVPTAAKNCTERRWRCLTEAVTGSGALTMAHYLGLCMVYKRPVSDVKGSYICLPSV